MPRNKASRLRLTQPEPEPEPEPQGSDAGDEFGSSLGSDAGSIGSADEYETQLHAIFQRADRNDDGSLRRAELILRLRKDEELAQLLGLPLEAGHAQRKALDALFAGMDTSGDGHVDEVEFVRYFADQAAKQAAAAAAAAAEQALSISERIGRIYEVHNPKKIEQIDALLAEWEGEEELLYKNIKEKYAIPDDFFAPETPGSATGSEATSSQHTLEDQSEQEDEDSVEEQSAVDKGKRRREEEQEIAARYQWMVDLQREQDGEAEEEQETEDEEPFLEDDEEETDQDQCSSSEGDDDDGEEDDDESDKSTDEEYEKDSDADTASEYGSAVYTRSTSSNNSVEHDGDLGVTWDEENLHEIQRKSEFIKQAKVFRVKITRDSTGRGTYSEVYAPENQESKRGKNFRDPEILRKQDQVDKIAYVGEHKRRKSSARAKISDPELAAIAAGVRAKINGGSARSSGSEDSGGSERPWQKKLRERWDRPMDDSGMYSVDTEMVRALKERKKLREESEAAAKTGTLFVSQYQYESEGGDDIDDSGEVNGKWSDATGTTAGHEDAEYYSEDGEEQEMFRVVRRRNRGRVKMSRVTAVKKKKRTTSALTPRAVRNQLMLDKLADVQLKDAEAAAAAMADADGEEVNGQSADRPSDEHLPRAKANRNINVKHADGSSSWIRKGQVIVITEEERGQPCRGYLEGHPQQVGVFLKSKIIIRTEEQLSMFASISDTAVVEEHENDDEGTRQTAQADEEEQDLEATTGTAISSASAERNVLAGSSQGQSRISSPTSSLRKSPSPSLHAGDSESPVGACRFCGFFGPVLGHPTAEFPDCPHEPVIKAPASPETEGQRIQPNTARSGAASEKSGQAGSDWSAEMWSALPVGDFFDLRKDPAPSNADLMARVTNPNDESRAAGERPMTPETWAEGASGQLSQKEPWVKLMRTVGVKPEPRPATDDVVLAPSVVEATRRESTELNDTATQKENDVRAVEARLEKIDQDKDKLFMTALAGVEAVISRVTTPQEQPSIEAEQQAEAERAKVAAEKHQALVKDRQQEAAATKIAALQRGKIDRARVVKLREAKAKEHERTALFKKLRGESVAAAKMATDPKAAAQAEEEKAAAVAKAQVEAEEAEDAAIEKAELSDVFVTLDPPASQIVSSVADTFLGGNSGRILPLNSNGSAASLPALTRPKQGLEAAKRLPRDPQLWSTEHVCEWLAGLGLQEYQKNFEEQSISGDTLLELSAADLRDGGGLRIARLGHRKLLTKAIGQLQYRSESDLTLAL